MTVTDYGVQPGVMQAERAICAAALHCTAEEVQATGLASEDFFLKSCQDVWAAVLEMECPTQVALANHPDPNLVVEAQRWIGEHWTDCHPAGLRAIAPIVRRDSERRKQLAWVGKEAARIGRGELAPSGGVSLEFDE